MREYTTSYEENLLSEMNLGDNYICDAINDGFPLCCVTSTDSFLRHDSSIYKSSILITPVPENPEVLAKLTKLAESGIGVIMYGTQSKLQTVPEMPNTVKLDVKDGAGLLRETAEKFGYSIMFNKKADNIKPPTMAVYRSDNGMYFSVYNANTTTDTLMRFPLGAPVLCGMETELTDGYASCRFSRGEHRECRAFVNQASGVISCREAPPVNARFRRAIRLTGFEDATVILFPEDGCECAVSTAPKTDHTPEFDPRFRLIHDEVHGTYLKGEHISGSLYFLMGRKS